MRDYSDLLISLRCCTSDSEPCEHCNCELEECNPKIIMEIAADAIEELLAASPPALWTDEPIEGTGFMTHTQGGGKGFEIHFRTDSLEKYKAVQEECRRQIDHAKTEPPKKEE